MRGKIFIFSAVAVDIKGFQRFSALQYIVLLVQYIVILVQYIAMLVQFLLQLLYITVFFILLVQL